MPTCSIFPLHQPPRWSVLPVPMFSTRNSSIPQLAEQLVHCQAKAMTANPIRRQKSENPPWESMEVSNFGYQLSHRTSAQNNSHEHASYARAALDFFPPRPETDFAFDQRLVLVTGASYGSRRTRHPRASTRLWAREGAWMYYPLCVRELRTPRLMSLRAFTITRPALNALTGIL
jgi:hypothetical protein